MIGDLRTTIGKVSLCEKYGVFAESQVLVMPEVGAGIEENYRILCDNESSQPSNWTEVNDSFWMFPGDIAIKR